MQYETFLYLSVLAVVFKIVLFRRRVIESRFETVLNAILISMGLQCFQYRIPISLGVPSVYIVSDDSLAFIALFVYPLGGIRVLGYRFQAVYVEIFSV